MSLGTILVILLALVLPGVIPRWPYSLGWGYGPGEAVGLVLLTFVLTGGL
jgi:hypothetical protein